MKAVLRVKGSPNKNQQGASNLVKSASKTQAGREVIKHSTVLTKSRTRQLKILTKNRRSTKHNI